MGKTYIKPSSRLLILIVDIGILLIISRIAFGHWTPPCSKMGFWFYIGLLSLLLGSRLVTPFYLTPGNAVAYTVSGIVALFLINEWKLWSLGERVVFSGAVGYCSIVAFIALLAILIKDRTEGSLQKIEHSCRIASDLLGSPRAVYSSVILFAIYVFHRDSPAEVLWIGIAWAVTVAVRPIETVVELTKRVKHIWTGRLFTPVVGEVVAYQTPGIVLIRQQDSISIPFGSLLLIKNSHAPTKMAIVLDYTGRDEGMLLRAIEAGDAPENSTSILSKPSQRTVAVKIDPQVFIGQSEKQPTVLARSEELVGIVAPESSIERLYFEVVQEKDLEKNRLVETYVGDQQVLYQVLDGLTKEDIIYQKNTYGYARAQAQQIGIWNEEQKKFRPAEWIPRLNTPVFLKAAEDYEPDANAVGHFPHTNYIVGIENINELVTHNTAILGILGVGKSMLAIELVERMITNSIKVICLDLTNQYAEQLEDFYDAASEEQKLKKIFEAGQKDQEEWAENPERGGSLPNFTKAMQEDLREFLGPDTAAPLKIYNPAYFFATKQTSEPRSFMVDRGWTRGAALWTVTPVEITRIISELTLTLLQDEMSDKARVCLVYEEAHCLIPEFSAVATEGDKVATNGTARAILQGRKYGLGCLLVTQRTANVTKTILNQCNTIFAMRSFDETAKNFLADYIGRAYAEKLSLMRERHAVFFGRASSCENPVLIRLNDREDFLRAFREERSSGCTVSIKLKEVEDGGEG